MVDIRTFGGINLNDSPTYWVPVRTETSNPHFDIAWEAIRNSPGPSVINLGLDDETAEEISFEVWVRGDGWQSTLSSYEAIRAMCMTASRFSRFEEGEQITYVESNGDQTTPTVHNVVRAQFVEVRNMRAVHMLRMVGRLTLLCEPRP